MSEMQENNVKGSYLLEMLREREPDEREYAG
jgi:hypothetical protein